MTACFDVRSAMAVFVVCIALASCGPSGGDSNSDSATADASLRPAPDPVEQHRPSDEAALLMHDKAVGEMEDAPNDIMRQKAKDKWDKAFCAAVMNVNKFTNWTGNVSHITSVDDIGKVEVNLGRYVILVSAIKSDTPIYEEISYLLNPVRGSAVRAGY